MLSKESVGRLPGACLCLAVILCGLPYAATQCCLESGACAQTAARITAAVLCSVTRLARAVGTSFPSLIQQAKGRTESHTLAV
jgi:hypothetical protein